jgi:hypothetical protein
VLQNITITLGEEDFVMTPWEYTIEVNMKDLGYSEKRCMSAFMPKQAYGYENYIVLGSAFLRAFYGVFDLDQRTVSCEFLYHPLCVVASFAFGADPNLLVARATSQKIETKKVDRVEKLKKR